MNLLHHARNQRGYLLLPVIMVLTLVAIVSYLLNRSTALQMDPLSSRKDTIRARYVAEAALSQAKWYLSWDCRYRTAMANQPFMGHSYDFTLTDNPDGTIHLTSQATLGSGVTQSLVEDYRCLPHLYLTDHDLPALRRADQDGTSMASLLDGSSGIGTPGHLIIDEANKQLYFADHDRIFRSNLDGTQLTEVLSCWFCQITGLGLDPAAGKLYFLDDGNNRIRRADLDGSNRETVVLTPGFLLSSFALDPSNGLMFWSDEGTRKLYRANLDGTGQTALSSGSYAISALALDPAGQNIYFYAVNLLSLYKMNYSGIITLLTNLGAGAAVHGIDFDGNGNKVYWTDSGNRRIERSEADGASRQTIYTCGAGENPWGVMVAPY